MNLKSVREFLAENWEKTFINPSTFERAPTEMALPAPYVVPTVGSHFRSLFYWDAYFTAEGLVRDGHAKMARSTAENFLHMIETMGHIPSRSKNNFGRSQPPVSSRFYRLVFEQFGDRTWLRRATRALEWEHAFWMSQRMGIDGLNCYGHHHTPQEVRNFYWGIRDRMNDIPEEPDAQLIYLNHRLAEAESGWDFTPRFENRCADFYPVDLNCLLFSMENDLADFLEILGDANAPKWREKAEARRQRIDQILWSEEMGAYLDYDLVNRRHSKVFSAASFYALFCGVADEKKAARTAENLHRIETDYGVDTCEPGERVEGMQYQWDSPNGWAPLQIVAMGGLARYGYKEESQCIARNHLTLICKVFESTGNLWEKYNIREGSLDVTNEYAMPPMLGWTGGSILYATDLIGELESSAPDKPKT